MTLATATPDGQPAARMVLLRGLDARGFVFFTNYDSRKGQELAANPRAALVFWWDALKRQVRIEGRIEVVTAAESDAYFKARPRGHRLAALASPQSQVIPDRASLEQRMRQLETQYPGEDVPRPANWGGYRVVPAVIEFWQGRPNRVHDRLRYERLGDDWRIQRLAP
jgi:pyridoxamine 5'-phosphate oxidase